MNPELVKQLLDSESGRAVIAYLNSEAEKLNTLSDLELDDKKIFVPSLEIAIEVKVRKEVYKKIMAMLEPLLNSNNTSGTGVTNKDYLVD